MANMLQKRIPGAHYASCPLLVVAMAPVDHPRTVDEAAIYGNAISGQRRLYIRE